MRILTNSNASVDLGGGEDGSRTPLWHSDRCGAATTLRLSGDWTARETGVRTASEVHRILDDAGATTLRIDTSDIGAWDSALIAFLTMLRDAAANGTTRIDGSEAPEAARRLLALTATSLETIDEEKPPISFLTRIGEAYYGALAEAVEIAALVGNTALRAAAAFVRRCQTRAADVAVLVREAGPGALAIVAVVNCLIGAILAFVGAMQLRKFGAGIYVANLVGIAVVREMAAIGTAIVMAGRTGGAYAAHLATMQGNEEIDALNVLGVRIFDFLILPRVAALVAMMPLLYLYGAVTGLAGGFAVSLATLDLTPAQFIGQLRDALDLTQFAIGLTKSVCFAVLVALAACQIGLKAGRSAAAVGHAATSAVVAGIVGVIALDAIFAICANALGI
jgi:phospholipid/cholesterol/gamma-HCH transport system permease protein